MPALGNRGVVSPKAIAKAAKEPAKPIAKLPGVPSGGGKMFSPPKGEPHAPMANLPAYKAPGKPSAPSGPFSPKLQDTFGPLGKQGVGAPSQLAKDQRGAQTSRDALGTIGTALSWGPALAAGPPGVIGNLMARNIGEHTAGTTKAFVKDPTGVTKKTLSSLPAMANALAMTGVRLGEETGLGVAKLTGANVPKGQGEPGKALGEFAKGAVKGTIHTIGENQKEVEQEVGKEGAANQILTYAPAGGGVGAITGRLASKALEAAGIGAKDFAAVQAARDAALIAHQHPAMSKFLEGRGAAAPVAPALSRATKAKAFLHESAAQPRPNLRTAPGNEPAKVQPGAAVKPQERSPNLFRASGQTALDNARRAYQLHGLERVGKEQQAYLADHPHVNGDQPVTYAQHLANLTKQGEVTPLFQKGGLSIPGVSHFVGATKQQRMGASYPKADLVQAGQNARGVVAAAVQPALKDLSPVQRKLVVLAKEGHFPLHDPQAAQTWLQEISRQAKQGSSNGTLIPLVHRMTGSDVGRQVDSVLAHMQKHGPESVVTPQFQKLVQAVPDERMVSGKDPILKQIPDEVAARKYLPQQQTLDAWAQHELTKPNPHPDAGVTEMAVRQIHEKLQAGKDLRRDGRNAEADREFAQAKNLADENAKRHGLPTDRAYIKHQRTIGKENWLHTVGQRSPSEEKQWRSVLQRQGYRSTDPRLIEDAMLKSIRNHLAVEHIAKFDQRFRVPGLPDGMTAKEAHQEMLKRGLNPEHYEVAHLGKVFQGMKDRQVGGADMLHLDVNPADHAKAMGDLLQQARGVHPADTTKGATIYPKTALDELHGALSQSGMAGRVYGKVKGSYSSLMLGTSPAWATTMGLVTYPSQALMGGAAPWNAWRIGAGARYYDRMGTGAKREFDQATGTDNPFTSSHEGRTEKIGSTGRMVGKPPAHIEDLINSMKLWSGSPLGKFLHNNRPDRIVLKLERVPRRYARIGVATKHMKSLALDKMLAESKGLQGAQSQLEKSMIRLQHLGRMPSAQYMDEVLKSVPHMEEVARRTSVVMGEWKKMTNFERNLASKIPLFYPWVRYSVKLAAKSLPANHPLMYGFAGQLATMSNEHLKELLGTEAPTGKAPLGRAQPQLEPEERQWGWAGAPQADPLLNVVTEILSGKPSKMVGGLPPFVAAPLEWAVNRGSFTDKPLKKSEPYKRGEHNEERPSLAPYLANKTLGSFLPGRALQDITAKGRPQSDESLLGSAPMHYSPRTESSIEEGAEEKNKRSAYGKVGKYAFPLLPHTEPGLLRAKLKEEEKAKKKEEAAGAGAGW